MQTACAQPSTDEWVATHLCELRRHLQSRLACDADAQDIAQEACLSLLQVQRPESIQNPKAYLYRIAHNLLYRYYNDRWNSMAIHHEIDVFESPQPAVDDAVVHDVRLEQINRALQELPPKCQTALVLRWREGLRVAEIAERMSLSRAMIKKYLAYGLAHFRKRLRSYVLTDQPHASIARGRERYTPLPEQSSPVSSAAAQSSDGWHRHEPETAPCRPVLTS